MLYKLYDIIKDRQSNPRSGSYTNQLLEQGQDRILQKIGEEAVELIVAAGSQGDQRMIEETADLIYHLYVVLAMRHITLADIENELEQRHAPENN